MTTEIEKQFFDTFGIEAKTYLICTSGWDCIDAQSCEECVYSKLIAGEYPQITDHILLELICIAHTSPVITFVSRDVKNLKEEVLMVLCNWVSSRNIKQQVQAIFKGDNNNDR